MSFSDTIACMTHPLRTFRREAGISLKELAGQVGLTKSFLAKIELRKAWPSASTMSRLVAATNGAVTASDFMPSDQETAA